MTLLTDIPVTAAGENSWEWQLRDKNGRWIQMGSEVSFSHQGKMITGVIVGSPGPGKATIRLANGSTVTVPTAGVAATGKGAAPAADAPAGTPAAKAPAAAPAAPAAPRQIKAVSTDLSNIEEQERLDKEQEDIDRRDVEADRRAAAAATKKKATAKKTRTKSRTTKVSSKSGSGNEGAEAPDDRRLQGTHRTSRSIEGLLRIRAKELGRKDPFGESKDDSESKESGSKDGEKSSSEESSGGAGASGSKTTKKKDTRKELTQSQIDAVNVIFAAVLKHVKAGEYSTALSRLKNAKAILKDTSAPWLSKRIFFLTKGLKGVQGIQSSGQMIEWTPDLLAALVGAAGTSWRWQLRDKKGQWIDMGSRVSWLMKGALHTGILIGSPKEGTARVRDDKDGAELNLPAASRLIALAEIGSKVRYTPGGKNPKAVLAKVIGRPVDAKGREKKGRLTIRTLAGTEKEVAEGTLEVLPLDATRAAVREYGGYSVKIDGTLPETGYMAAQLKGSKQFTPEEFFGPDGEDLIMDFMRDNAKQFDDDPDVYLGVWYDKDEKGQPPEPKVVIDVSHNIQDRDTAILAGNYQNQKSIWDVVKQEEIDTGGTGGYDEARGEVVRPSDEEGVGDVGRGVATLGPTGDSGGEGVVDDRKWLTRPPPVGGLRIVEAKSSMTAHGPEAWEFINNDGGTLANPKHRKDGAGAMTVSMSEMADQYTEVIRAAQQGIPYSDKASLERLAKAHLWYVEANQVCRDLLTEFSADPDSPKKKYIPDLTMEKVTGVMAAMSPQMPWDRNIDVCRKILEMEADPEFRNVPTAQAKDLTGTGNTTNVKDALLVLRDEGTPQEIMGGLKRRSFWNCLMDPTNDWDVCVDGWMAAGTFQAGLTYADGSPLNEKALGWLGDGKTQIAMEDSGAGYIVLADAVRIAAARTGLTPLEAQAVYWVAVGGGTKNGKMWSDLPSAGYLAWRQEYLSTQASEREARLEKALLPIEAAAMIPEYTSDDDMDFDDADAVFINDMATGFKADVNPIMSIPSAWYQARPHPDTGTMIEFCWENPAAWTILAGDVDRDWFMEQLATRDVEPQP